MLRPALVFLLVAGCATEPAVEPVTPAPPPTVMVDDEPKAPEPEKKLTPEEERTREGDPESTAPISGEEGQFGRLESDGEGSIGIGTIGKRDGTGAGQGFGLGSGRLGRTRQGAMNVQGSLDKEIIRRTVQRELRAIRACYERELAKQPNLAGRLAVRFVIAPAGHVTEANAETTLDPNVDTCVVSVFKRMTFPKPKGDAPVVVRYPLIFQTTETK